MPLMVRMEAGKICGMEHASWCIPGSMGRKFCREQNIGGWQVAAQDKAPWLQYSRVEPACPKAAPLGRRETTKPKLISTLTTSASKIQ